MLETIIKFDQELIRLIERSFSSGVFNRFFAFFTHLGDFGFLTIVVLLYIIFSTKDQKISKIIIISMFLSLLAVQIILKNVIARPRPFEVMDGIRIFINHPTTYAFPSGHASFSTVGLVFTHRYIEKKRLKYGLELVFFLIIISRLFLKVHYLTDVIAGVMVSYVIIWIVTFLINKKPQFN